jgi:pilus assembly protein Flp/PilA
MKRPLKTILRDERGASAVEYGLIAALIIIAMLVGLVQLAATTTGMWNNVSSTTRAAAPL